MGIFLRWGDQHIPGLTPEAGYEKWIALERFDWTCTAAVRGSAQSSRERWHIMSEAVSCRRRMDLMSPILIDARMTGRPVDTVEVHFTRTEDGTGSHRCYHGYTLTKAWIGSYDVAAATGDWPRETFEVFFDKVEIRHWQHDNAGRAVPSGVAIYDRTANRG